MISKFKEIIIFSFKYLPILFLIVVPVQLIYGTYSTWDTSSTELKKYKHKYRIFTGGSSERFYSKENSYYMESKTYIIFDKGLSNIKSITISKHSKNGTSVEIEDGGLIQLILTYLFLMFCVWFMWFRKGNVNEVQT